MASFCQVITHSSLVTRGSPKTQKGNPDAGGLLIWLILFYMSLICAASSCRSHLISKLRGFSLVMKIHATKATVTQHESVVQFPAHLDILLQVLEVSEILNKDHYLMWKCSPVFQSRPGTRMKLLREQFFFFFLLV